MMATATSTTGTNDDGNSMQQALEVQTTVTTATGTKSTNDGDFQANSDYSEFIPCVTSLTARTTGSDEQNLSNDLYICMANSKQGAKVMGQQPQPRTVAIKEILSCKWEQRQSVISESTVWMQQQRQLKSRNTAWWLQEQH